MKGPKIGHLLSVRGARMTDRPNELRHWTRLAHATGVLFGFLVPWGFSKTDEKVAESSIWLLSGSTLDAWA